MQGTFRANPCVTQPALPGPGAARRCLASAFCLALGAACAEKQDPSLADEATAVVLVELAYPSQQIQRAIAGVHLWAFERDDGSPDVCPVLVGDALDPYDLSLSPRVDQVSVGGPDSLEAQSVTVGPTTVYVEAVDAEGAVALAACAEVTIEGGSASIDLELATANVYDCTDPAASDGSPCDDGLRCTVGEVCRNQACGEGRAVDCAVLAGPCAHAECDEDLGCVASPLPQGAPCDDDDPLTANDQCTDEGVCAGD